LKTQKSALEKVKRLVYKVEVVLPDTEEFKDIHPVAFQSIIKNGLILANRKEVSDVQVDLMYKIVKE